MTLIETTHLFDTSVLIQILRRDQAIIQRRAQITTTAYLNATVLGELLLGAKRSSQVANGLTEVQTLVLTMRVLPIDETTSDVYSDIARDLRSFGQPIPENDVWIAASSLQYGLTLVTRDAHFTRVSGLLIEQW